MKEKDRVATVGGYMPALLHPLFLSNLPLLAKYLANLREGYEITNVYGHVSTRFL